MTDRCQIPRCRADADVTYLSHGICSRHWNEFTNENAPTDALRIALRMPAAPEPITEDTPMSKNAKTAEQTEAIKKAPKIEKTNKARAPKADAEELRTVAVRVTQAEFDLLHKAAGPRNLGGFIKTTIMAAAEKMAS